MKLICVVATSAAGQSEDYHSLDIDGEFRSDIHKWNIEIQLNLCYCWGGKLTNKMRDPVANLSPTSV